MTQSAQETVSVAGPGFGSTCEAICQVKGVILRFSCSDVTYRLL